MIPDHVMAVVLYGFAAVNLAICRKAWKRADIIPCSNELDEWLRIVAFQSVMLAIVFLGAGTIALFRAE